MIKQKVIAALLCAAVAAILALASQAQRNPGPRKQDLGDLVQGSYLGDVTADTQGGGKESVAITVVRVGINLVQISSNYARLGTVSVSLTEATGKILNAGGSTTFLFDPDKNPPHLDLTFNDEVSWGGDRRGPVASAAATTTMAAPGLSDRIANQSSVRGVTPPTRGAGEPPARSIGREHVVGAPAGGSEQSDCDSTVSSITPIGTPQYVTMDYLRMHRPDVIAGIASQVRQGKLPPSALEGFASNEVTRRVIEADWSGILARHPKDALIGAVSNVKLDSPPPCLSVRDEQASGSRPQFDRRVSMSGSGRDQALDSATISAAAENLASLFTLDVAPARLDLGTVPVDERKRATLHIVAMRAGRLQIALAPGSFFRVVRITRNTGVLRQSEAGLSKPVAGGMVGTLAGDTIGGGTTLSSGQSADVVLEFKPTRQEGFDGSPRTYQSSVTVSIIPDLASRVMERASEMSAPADLTRTIALSANVAGYLYGIGIAVDAPTVYANPRLQFKVYFDWYNNGVAGDATVSVDPSQLPLGITPAGPLSTSVHLDAGEEKTSDALTFNGPPEAPAGEKYRTMMLTLTQRSAQGVQTTVYPVYLYLDELAARYDCGDMLEIPGRATVLYFCQALEMTSGYWQVEMTVATQGSKCESLHDNTTVRIDPVTVYSQGGEFHNGDYGVQSYYADGVSGSLRNDFDEYHGPIRVWHTVRCFSKSL